MSAVCENLAAAAVKFVCRGRGSCGLPREPGGRNGQICLSQPRLLRPPEMTWRPFEGASRQLGVFGHILKFCSLQITVSCHLRAPGRGLVGVFGQNFKICSLLTLPYPCRKGEKGNKFLKMLQKRPNDRKRGRKTAVFLPQKGTNFQKTSENAQTTSKPRPRDKFHPNRAQTTSEPQFSQLSERTWRPHPVKFLVTVPVRSLLLRCA